MVKVIWTEPALSDLEAIANYISLDNHEAASKLVQRVFKHVEQLIEHPMLGSIPPELRPIKIYRQIVEPPCRVFFRIRSKNIFIVHVMRGEQLLDRRNMTL